MILSNPNLLPKVRSDALTRSANFAEHGIPCTARVASFIPGHRCSDPSTNVFAHYGKLGKGMSTKASDLNGFIACGACHDLIDARDARVWEILDAYPRAFFERIIEAGNETRAHWVGLGIVSGRDWVVV